jgi:hypothetical protein
MLRINYILRWETSRPVSHAAKAVECVPASLEIPPQLEINPTQVKVNFMLQYRWNRTSTFETVRIKTTL